MTTTFATLATEFHEHFTRDANKCAQLGVNRRLGDLPDPSSVATDTQVKEGTALLSRFEALDKAPLSFDDTLDTELAMLMLRSELHSLTYTFNGKTQKQQMPNAGDEIGSGIFLLFVNDPRDPKDRLADITSRLESVPGYLDAALAQLDTPVARWVSMDVEMVQGLPHLFKNISDWAATTNFEQVPRLKSACHAAERALTDYLGKLTTLPTTTQLHVGDDHARKIIAYRGIDKSFDQLRDIARTFLSETRATIETLRQKLTAKYNLPSDTTAADLHRHLNERYRVDLPNGEVDDILAHYHQEHDNILAFIRERDLFPIPDDQSLTIMRTPSFMAPSVPAGAMWPPAPFREGVATSVVYLTLSRELVDEHTHLTIPGMMVHEGIPGHHLQLATASTHPSTIRRHVETSDHAEGWTTMLEDYMLDVGYKAELADEVRFCSKRDISRIGARVAIDLFFMTGNKDHLSVGVDCDLSSDDPFVAAGNLLQTVTGFVPERVQAELDWYSQERGYPLSYLVGNDMVWKLKADVTRTLSGKHGAQEIDRRFHAAFLNAGNMPLTSMRRVFANQGIITE